MPMGAKKKMNQLVAIINELRAENNALRSQLNKTKLDFTKVENVSLTLEERECLLSRKTS